jgi:hypothetical protein
MASQTPEVVQEKRLTADNVDKIEEAQYSEFSAALTGKMLNEDARLATQAEHDLGLWKGINTYRKAVFWSVVISFRIVMEGYDTTLISSFFAYPAFKQKYGTFHLFASRAPGHPSCGQHYWSPLQWIFHP